MFSIGVTRFHAELRHLAAKFDSQTFPSIMFPENNDCTDHSTYTTLTWDPGGFRELKLDHQMKQNKINIEKRHFLRCLNYFCRPQQFFGPRRLRPSSLFPCNTQSISEETEEGLLPCRAVIPFVAAGDSNSLRLECKFLTSALSILSQFMMTSVSFCKMAFDILILTLM